MFMASASLPVFCVKPILTWKQRKKIKLAQCVSYDLRWGQEINHLGYLAPGAENIQGGEKISWDS